MPTLTSYLTVTAANALAAELPGLAAWAAASSGAKETALNQASSDVDAGVPYQGRVYESGQALQFPRVAEDGEVGADSPAAVGGLSVVWDWDADTNTAVVPRDVKVAVLIQADSILAGTREARISAQHDGVVYELTGSLAESYKLTPGVGANSGLCRRAWALVRKYRLRSGRMV